MQAVMFKTKSPNSTKVSTPSIITKDMHILGNVVHEGVIDFDGTIDGNIRCDTLTIRENGSVKGEITANNLFVFGKVNGIIRAKNVHLHGSCHIEGIVMHESLSIEDGAFIDGKCKRTDKLAEAAETLPSMPMMEPEDEESAPPVKMLENIRLIR
jgi:cytoskeletal protein CcmA (bactofilin family)